MNNPNADDLINNCRANMTKMRTLIDVIGSASPIVPFFNDHAAVIASGAIEQSFKTIIADSFISVGHPQLQNFIDNKIRESSMNPSLSNIHNTLESFDETWNNQLKTQISAHPDAARIRTSIQSLVNARNTIAHGKSSTVTIDNTIAHFEDACIVLEMIDNIVNGAVVVQ